MAPLDSNHVVLSSDSGSGNASKLTVCNIPYQTLVCQLHRTEQILQQTSRHKQPSSTFTCRVVGTDVQTGSICLLSGNELAFGRFRVTDAASSSTPPATVALQPETLLTVLRSSFLTGRRCKQNQPIVLCDANRMIPEEDPFMLVSTNLKHVDEQQPRVILVTECIARISSCRNNNDGDNDEDVQDLKSVFWNCADRLLSKNSNRALMDVVAVDDTKKLEEVPSLNSDDGVLEKMDVGSGTKRIKKNKSLSACETTQKVTIENSEVIQRDAAAVRAKPQHLLRLPCSFLQHAWNACAQLMLEAPAKQNPDANLEELARLLLATRKISLNHTSTKLLQHFFRTHNLTMLEQFLSTNQSRKDGGPNPTHGHFSYYDIMSIWKYVLTQSNDVELATYYRSRYTNKAFKQGKKRVQLSTRCLSYLGTVRKSCPAFEINCFEVPEIYLASPLFFAFRSYLHLDANVGVDSSTILPSRVLFVSLDELYIASTLAPTDNYSSDSSKLKTK